MNIDVSLFAKPCSCGRTHQISVQDIFIEPGAIRRLPGLVASRGFRVPAIVCDENTYRAAGAAVRELLPESGLAMLNPDHLHANEHGVAAAEEKLAEMPQAPDVLLAVGSGTVHDITRFLAHKRVIPFLSVPTAASVDGFVSTVAAMTWHGCKKTLPAVAPILVAADSDVFSQAPHRLNASGLSDLLGKYTALADWKIAHAVTGEYICERVCQLEYEALDSVLQNLDAIREGGREACENLMYALLLSGLAMQMVGNSRPASGAEHHMSHLWEMEVINAPVDYYHGEKVSVGLVLSSAIYHNAAALLKKGAYQVKDHMELEMDLLEKSFPDKAMREEIMDENRPNPLAQINPAVLREKAPEIVRIVEEIPVPQELVRLLKQGGCVYSLEGIGLPDSLLEPTARISPYVRARLTFMRLLKMFTFEENIFHCEAR